MRNAVIKPIDKMYEIQKGLNRYSKSSFDHNSDISNLAIDKQRLQRRMPGWPAGHFLGIACLCQAVDQSVIRNY